MEGGGSCGADHCSFASVSPFRATAFFILPCLAKLTSNANLPAGQLFQEASMSL